MLANQGLAEAHELSMNTARVSLRDAHLEMTADLDPLALLRHLHAGSSGNDTDMAPLDDTQVQALVARAKHVLETETRVEANGTSMALEIHLALEPNEVRKYLQMSTEERHEKAFLIPVRWEAKEPLVGVKQIQVVFPATLGPVLITFVQPTTHWTAPGTAAVFSVLEKPMASPRKNSWAEGAMVLAVVGILLNFGISRRKRSNEAPPSSLPRQGASTGR